MTDFEARNVLYQKLTDTVDWLDREINSLADCSPSYFVGFQIEQLGTLRDDLAETLSKTKKA